MNPQYNPLKNSNLDTIPYSGLKPDKDLYERSYMRSSNNQNKERPEVPLFKTKSSPLKDGKYFI